MKRRGNPSKGADGASSRLGREFFRQDPLDCARGLLGTRLQWGTRSGVVVETEAYDSEGDEACHAWTRPSTRAFIAAHEVGAAYVYLNYGVHWMLNVLVKGERSGLILIRALEPLDGLAAMRKARGVEAVEALCSGPGKLAKALGVTGADNGRDLCAAEEFSFHRHWGEVGVEVSPRIGISRAVDLLWRFYVPENPHVSAHPRGGERKKAGRVRKPIRP